MPVRCCARSVVSALLTALSGRPHPFLVMDLLCRMNRILYLTDVQVNRSHWDIT